MVQLIKIILITSLAFIVTLLIIKVFIGNESLNSDNIFEAVWKGVLFGTLFGGFRYMKKTNLDKK